MISEVSHAYVHASSMALFQSLFTPLHGGWSLGWLRAPATRRGAVVAIAIAIAIAVALVGVVAVGAFGFVGAYAGEGAGAIGVALLAVAALLPDVVTGMWIAGRPQRRHGRVVRPPATRGPAVKDPWLVAAGEEAEAVVAFDDLGRRLAAVGAPAALVAECQRAADDVVRHVRVCTRLAGMSVDDAPPLDRRSLVASPVTPVSPTPSFGVRRQAELVRLAVESFVDGMVGEGYAAGRLEAAADSSPLPAAVRSMAADERRHAALGADVVAWCASASPILVGSALRSAARRLPDHVGDGASNGRWVRARDDALDRLDRIVAER